MAANMWGRRAVAALAAMSGIVAGALVGVAPASAAATVDPERYSATPTGWAYYTSNSKAGIDAYASQNGMRVTGIEVAGTSPLTFAATMVRNSGTYARGSQWYAAETQASLQTKLSGKRLLDPERYVVGGQTRFAAVVVDNGASNFHDYRWYVNATPSYIADRQKAFGGRIVDIDRVSAGRYDAVMLKNTGVDAKSWWYYYNLTPAQISSYLSTNKARLVDIEPEGNGRFTVTMVKSAGEYWWWHHAATAAQVGEMQAQYGMRIYALKPYATAAGTRYAVLLINNLDAQGTAAWQALWGAAGDNAAFGFYLKRIDGPVHQSLQGNKKFEPASMIKALHHLTAMRAVRAGSATVGEDITWYRRPDVASTPTDESTNGGVCSYDNDGNPITTLDETDDLSVVLSGMMKQSDNRMTDAVFNRFGRSTINATADWLGMTNTELNHRIGCTWKASGQVAKSNELTLADDGKLFEAVFRANNPVLGTGTHRDQFYAYAGRYGGFKAVVEQEAAKLGKSAAVAKAFNDALRTAYKPGGYGNGAGTCNSSGCTHRLIRSTGGGYVGLPVKANGAVTHRSFVFGTFIDGTFACGANLDCTEEGAPLAPARTAAEREILRPHIRAALQTW
jgi:hypothetical protein